LQIKDRAVIKIDSVAFGGEGVGRIDNLVTFVPFSAPGDELDIEITQRKKRFLRGRIIRIIKPSPLRVEPLCRYYGNCGGCCYQHIRYDSQLAFKKKQVEDAFRKISKIADPPVADVLASPEIYHYRGKAQYHAEESFRGWTIGFLDVSGGRLVDIEHCELMEETINRQMRVLRESRKSLYSKSELAIWSDCSVGASGDEQSILRLVKGKSFLVPHGGFFQANLYLTDAMVDAVFRLAALDEINTIVDAYCGSGLFSIFLSSLARVTGIEINEQAVQYARINAGNHGMQNVDFIQGDVEAVLCKNFRAPEGKIDLFVLDPPRVGCEQIMLKSMVDLCPRKIIYISCNPATQARDVKYLNECGYRLQSLQPLDMFPQTRHIEVIGYLELR